MKSSCIHSDTDEKNIKVKIKVKEVMIEKFHEV